MLRFIQFHKWTHKTYFNKSFYFNSLFFVKTLQSHVKKFPKLANRGQQTQTIPLPLTVINAEKIWNRDALTRIFIFDLFTKTNLPPHFLCRYSARWWWMVRISRPLRPQRVKLAVLVPGSMYAHKLLYFYRGQWGKIWIILWVFPVFVQPMLHHLVPSSKYKIFIFILSIYV